MAALANLVIGDKTPTNRTFKPQYMNGLLASLIADYASKPALHPKITLGMRVPKPGVNRKVTIKIVVPYEVVDGDVTTIEEDTYFIEHVTPETAPVAAVQDSRAFAAGVLLNAIVLDALDNGNFPY